MRKRIAFPAALVAAGVAGAAGGAVGWNAVSGHDSTAPAIQASPRATATAAGPLTLKELYRRTAPGVVEVTVQAQEQDGSGFSQQTGATGSGFVIDEAGHIVTNEHVVENATSVTVRFANGDTQSARVVGSDASTDVAVLALDGSRDVTPLELGSSSSLSVGDPVAAIGSPFGLEGTLTSGIVSGLDRDIQAPDGFTISGAIQTDAALNHGNSGGPLLDARGRVVGIASQIESENGGNVGIGYAVPIDTARQVVRQILNGGDVRHAYLGVALGSESANGVTLDRVEPGTPAAKAGLRAGDVLTQVGGDRVASADDVRAAVDARKPGDRLEVRFTRAGEAHSVTVVLAERPQS